jgi:CII-binding regulator of phage lambda lysogenization HflD
MAKFAKRFEQNRKLNLAGDKIHEKLLEIINTNLPHINADKQIEPDHSTLFGVIVQNLSYRAASEHYEFSSPELEGGLENLYRSIIKKNGEENARETFLKQVSSYAIKFIFTPHPTEMLTNEAISEERKLSNILHSKGFIEWASLGFPANEEMEAKVSRVVSSLYNTIETSVQDKNLRNDHEIVRDVKFTERVYDATDLVMHRISKALEAVDGKSLSAEEVNKHIVPHKIIDVDTWASSDQDGKLNARPYFTEKKLFEVSKRAIDQLYINEVAKLYSELNRNKTISDEVKTEARKDVADMVLKLMNRIDKNTESFLDFYQLPENEQMNIIGSDKNRPFDRMESPNISRHILRLEAAAEDGRVSKSAVKLIKDVLKERIELLETSPESAANIYHDYRKDFIADINKFNEKYGQHLPNHTLYNGYKTNFNLATALSAKVSQFDDKALGSQLRQNSGDVEASFVYALKVIKKDGIKLTPTLETLITEYKDFDQLKADAKKLDKSIKKLEKNFLIAGHDHASTQQKIDELTPKLTQLHGKISSLSEQLTDTLSKAYNDVSAPENNRIRKGFKKFLSSRDDKFYNAESPENIANIVSQKENRPYEEVLAEVHAYDRLKSVKLAVDNPEFMRDYIIAEATPQGMFVQHILAKSLVEGKDYKNKLFTLPEAIDTIGSNAKDYAKLLDNTLIREQITKSMPANLQVAGENGKQRTLTTADILRQMGVNEKEITQEDKERKIEGKHLTMFPSSDILKVYSGPASVFLVTQTKYDLVKEFAKKGILLEFEEGVGSSNYRNSPRVGHARTVQGREKRISPESVAGEVISWISSNAKRMLGLEEVALDDKSKIEQKIANDPRFNFKNDDFGSFRFISKNPEEWKQLYSTFTGDIGDSYNKFYESAAFNSYFTHGALQEFTKLITFSARATVKTGDKDSGPTAYPAEADPEKFRAIQFGAALSMTNPHSGMMLVKSFTNDKGDIDLDKLNNIYKHYKSGNGDACPALQEALNKGAYGLATSDLRSAWNMFALERTNPGVKGAVKLGKEKVTISELANGNYDNLLQQHFEKKGFYKDIKDTAPEMYQQKISDTIVAAKIMAQMDVYTVQSRTIMGVIMNAVDKGKSEITQKDIDKVKFNNGVEIDSKNLMNKSMPHMHQVEIGLGNTVRRFVDKFLSNKHVDYSADKDTLPKKGDAATKTWYDKLYYAVSTMFETNERPISAVKGPQHAKAVQADVELAKGMNKAA